MILARYPDTGRVVLGQRAHVHSVDAVAAAGDLALAAVRARTDVVSVLTDGRLADTTALRRDRDLCTAFLDGSWRPWAVWPDD